jgi:molybdopterin synthase catalytic subunit
LFAGVAEAFGRTEVKITATEPLTPASLKDYMMSQFPDASEQIRRALVAVNQEYASGEVPLNESDEIALIPPVGGGSGDNDWSCRISATPLNVAEAYQALVDARNGGTVLFMGTVREWTKSRQTLYLTYEAYEEMALQQMKKIEEDVRREFPEAMTLQWHRVGRLEPTDIAVICGAAAPHRDMAFRAARTLIERLKAEVPIWKKEFYADGEVEWRENQS